MYASPILPPGAMSRGYGPDRVAYYFMMCDKRNCNRPMPSSSPKTVSKHRKGSHAEEDRCGG